MMRVLREGSVGDDVRAWQNFLLGMNPLLNIVVDGNFGPKTKDATIWFQKQSNSLPADGTLGPITLGKALQFGFDVLDDDAVDIKSTNWPTHPGTSSISPADRVRIFGQFSFVHAPSPQNPEAITITDGWVTQNIVTVNVPQFANIVGAPRSCNVSVHRLVANQLVSFWKAWEDENLLNRVISWSGSYVPRYVRGSRTHLSNHSWGTAFDINSQWNGLGTTPARVGEKGSVRELVMIAYDHGFYWGGWFGPARPDGMHFECNRVT